MDAFDQIKQLTTGKRQKIANTNHNTATTASSASATPSGIGIDPVNLHLNYENYSDDEANEEEDQEAM